MDQVKENVARTFVLVHGAWAGAWALQRLAQHLTDHGHHVYVPTLSGLGERSHLLPEAIDLTTHVFDVVNEIRWKDLDDIILVGFSYGGMVITGAAEIVRERIRCIVYVDGFLPANNQSFADITGLTVAAGTTPPPPIPLSAFESVEDHSLVTKKVTSQPTSTFTERLALTDAYQTVPRKLYIQATGWNGPFQQLVKMLEADPSWSVLNIECGHDVANLRPGELASMLLDAASLRGV